MKSVKTDKADEVTVSYPCLMISDGGRIVLFTSHGIGTAVHVKTGILGEHSDDWAAGYFIPYTGTVCLSN